MDAATLNTETPSAARIAEYASTHPHGGYQPSPYRNSFWESGRPDDDFTYWLGLYHDPNSRYQREEFFQGLEYIPSMANAIYEEAYEVHALYQASQPEKPLEEWEQALLTPSDPTVDEEIRAAFPGAIPDDKLAKLRTLITENRELKRKLEATESEEIDLSDRRLWPAFGKVAAAADEAGYCSEYDRMSEAGGFPTRDDLREAGMLPQREYTADLYVDVTTTFTTRVRVTTGTFESESYDDASDYVRESWEDLVLTDDEEIREALAAQGITVPSNADFETELDYVNTVDRA